MSARSIEPDLSPSRGEDAERRALWILLALGAALMVAAVASGDSATATATRTERFNPTLAAGTNVRVANVNGDVVASPGATFSALVTTTVMAPTQARAEEILGRARVEQSTEAGKYRLETRWPAEGPHSRGRHGGPLCHDCRLVSRFELVLPPGIEASLQTVNGEVRVRDVDGNLELHSVNGDVRASGVRRSLTAQTVNGRVEAEATSVPAGASWQLQTVNGPIVATLPKTAKFDWSASTMGGTISSTFALPAAREGSSTGRADSGSSGQSQGGARAHRAVIVREQDDGQVVIDTEQLSREIEEALGDAEIEVRDSGEDLDKSLRQLRVVLPGRDYTAKVGGGGPTIKTNTLNGNIVLLAAGTRESDARPLVSGRRAIVVTVPKVEVRAPDVTVSGPSVRVRPSTGVAIRVPSDPGEQEDEVIRGDIAGDFLSTSNGSYRVGHVSGKLRILTHAGEIHVASVGNGAEIKTYGGDIRIGPVRGDLKAQTLAGDVRIGDVTGSANVETSGGDIRIDRIAGTATARTGGGDIVIPSVGGAVLAETGGGEVRIGLGSRLVKGGVSIRNAGGDVLLTLPADFQGDVDLRVDDPGDPEDVLIHSEFPGMAVTRRTDSQRASGSLNGGGPRVTVLTTSGSIRLRRGPSSGS
ncbi:MAG TPA: DUF4097 family beta strand repeat-containing protein [Thermoanaerobaculia bacterium]|nr:DUF4097 family beta strand repeat-containing protein [Thermoanaerobaculia bacterium]